MSKENLITNNIKNNLFSGHKESNNNIPIAVTDKALNRIKNLITQKQENQDNCIGIRIIVKQKGCFGFKYNIEYAYDIRPFEVKIEKTYNNTSFVILIEPKAMMFISGTVIDYYEDMLSSGFTFKNPNEKGRCGCGESFYV
ncbi:HesB/IscA family protein [Candidatus Neoehrlichia procyonis]|uniref:Iron-sulfur cluster assembly accessory family protein n=1 Tax=Candidatus Neoehrlichia procyonis str. RAC413 TaxID=1359163 RepID=A0A0F3NM88_9RICK|nr:iron-sulfur cluster assembly accessory protein [Candidatus Neoehrlichia lotoris]KJV68817.1 iron-sulfur cluster assembly accessory family protein [Candidatus Neoehrlichia lotoris str. RAC413]